MNALNTPPARTGRQRRWPFVVLAVLLVLAAAVAVCESLGWPFLATPLQRVLAERLDRRVNLSAGGDDALRIKLLGGVRLQAGLLEIGAPPWSQAPHLLRARDVIVDLRYADLWRARQGQPLRVRRLKAAAVDATLERPATGRASWQFGPAAEPSAPPPPVPSFGSFQVADGVLRYRDVPLAIDIEARLSLINPDAAAAARAQAPASAPSSNGEGGSRLQLSAAGTYRKLPATLTLQAWGVLPWVEDDAQAAPVPITLNATIGRASMAFQGRAVDVLNLTGLAGRFSLKGPSLAAVGDPLGVTLPTTAAFEMNGAVVKKGERWNVVVDAATIGASRLAGAFVYEAGRAVPLLSGRLDGSRLMLVDLGPVLGTTVVVPAALAASAPAPLVNKAKAKGKVLPDRPFDLAALRVMDANVLIDIRDVDLNTRLLEPLRPLRGQLQLRDGVLLLRDLDARTAQGRLLGDVVLDGRGPQALWTAHVRWDGVRMERWIRLARTEGSPPYVTGRLEGSAQLRGQGRSTAEILASLKGNLRTQLRDGSVSHLIVEAAGLDLAESLAVLFQGDDALPVQCGLADLVADGGVFRPRVMVLDTTDSAVWITGSLSLATESMDLRAVVVPKDFSPLTLRTPLRVRGAFARPEVSVEKAPLGRKLATTVLLALINPLAALIPLVDLGSADDAGSAAACNSLKGRINGARPKLDVAARPVARPPR